MNVQQEPRISQLLPSVKCSDCGEMVEFRRLGEHDCQAAPAVPALPSAYKKPTVKNPPPVDDRPNLNPLSVPDNSYDFNRSPYDTTPSPTDSGYSGYSGSKYTSPPSSTSSPKGPTNFIQKYEQLTGKRVSSQSPSLKNPSLPIDNNQEYYNNGPKRFDRPQDNFSANNDYPNMYDNNSYGQGYGRNDQRKPSNNDRYNQQPPFDENNNRYNMNDPYRTGRPQDDRSVRPNDRYNNDYMRGDNRNKSPAAYDRPNGSSGNKYSPQQSQPPFSKPYMASSPQERNGTSDPYEGRRVDDLMNDLMKEMDSMQIKNNNTRDICAYCNLEITSSNKMWALGKPWHLNHLRCVHCRNPIDPNVGHVERDGNVFCPKDFADLFLPKCRRCNLPVEKEAVSASDGKLEGKWHVKCFGCHTCYKSFPDKSFYVFDNAPYCRRHYHKLNNSLCRTCDEPIEGPCAQTVEGWRYHPSCFVCVNCQVPLMKTYYSYDNKQYCETHIMEIKRVRKIRPERRQTMFQNI